MDWTVSTIIDQELCTGCGLCVRVCPSRTITMENGKAAVTGDRSIKCGHCSAVCPVNAVSVAAIDESLSSFATFPRDHRWLGHGEFDTAELVRLMASRRSCRNYKDAPLDRTILEDLVKIAITAPSATNNQLWTFTILPTREAVTVFGDKIRAFFEKLNAMSEKVWLRGIMKLVGKGELDFYYKNYCEPVKEALNDYRELGTDRLFYGAPAVLIIGSKPGGSMPKDDALLATQNALLAAHAMGLGSCLIGMAVEAMKNDRNIQRVVGIPSEETVYSVIALGHPDEKYRSPAGRKTVVPRYFEG
jgi:nitroreductase/NAD-dependent dihydropyrimidine dehydrogenase PreA subunit